MVKFLIFSIIIMALETNRGVAFDQKEFQRRKIERYQKQYDNFVAHVKGFLACEHEIDLELLKEGVDAERFLSYNDEEGSVVESDALYEARKKMMLSDSSINWMYNNDSKLYEVYSSIGGQASFMRGTYGDMSNTVPLSLKREMIAAQIEQLRKFDLLFEQVAFRKDKTQDPDGQIATLKEENYASFSEVMKKAIPYISADMSVAINHSGEYLRLRREFAKVGGVKEGDLNLLGEFASKTVRKILTDIYNEEFLYELEKFKADNSLLPDLAQRNELVRASSRIDEQFTRTR